ncbi:MAG: L-seryl-tRNA(Sec) selenium transferase [Acidimicrobiia bacterium]|nr:L-seryl-tRNA(Sec) selenium transferase [Acidimicrobiia bacterium]
MTLRDLPSVDALAKQLAGIPRLVATEIARASIAEARQAVLDGRDADATTIAATEAGRLRRAKFRPLINATGVLLHTNLGRAPVHDEAVAVAAVATRSYGNLEFDLDTGGRGGRGTYAQELLVALTGAESALIVNNNAAALLMTLAAIGKTGGVVVSRGELIEIGGSYRLPELMEASGARMVEVGTTNRTRIADYAARAADANLLLKVHPSNYRVVGFTESATSNQLVELSEQVHVPYAYDVGSGLIDESSPWIAGPPPAWLLGEPGVRQEVERGTDLTMFSGDKLFGGPQAGIIVGNGDLIKQIKGHPLARAVRVPGPTLAALAVIAEMYLDGRALEIPFWSMATATYEALEARLAAVIDAGIEGTVIGSESLLGAGSVPGMSVPSPVLHVTGPADQLWAESLGLERPLVGRREAGNFLIDLRSVDPADDEVVVSTLRTAVASCQ